MKKKLFLVFTILAFFIACNAAFTPINLTEYAQLLVDAVPTTLTDARTISDGMLGPNGLINNILIDTAASGNIIGETNYLDSIIAEITNSVSFDNTLANVDSGQIMPVSGGSLTLPFFNFAINADYAVSLGDGGKKSAYKIENTKQTIVEFHNGTPGVLSDYALTYGVKEEIGGVMYVDLWNALIGINADGSFNKSWAFDIHTEGLDWFELNHNSAIFTSTLAGQTIGYFLIRGREYDAASADIERIELWHFDGTTYVHTSDGSDILNDITQAGADMLETDIAKPADLDAALWTKMVTHINTNGDPDSAGIAPITLTDFNDSFFGF